MSPDPARSVRTFSGVAVALFESPRYFCTTAERGALRYNLTVN